jgi:hypothetical protein
MNVINDVCVVWWVLLRAYYSGTTPPPHYNSLLFPHHNGKRMRRGKKNKHHQTMNVWWMSDVRVQCKCVLRVLWYMCWTWGLLRMFATSPTTINKLQHQYYKQIQFNWLSTPHFVGRARHYSLICPAIGPHNFLVWVNSLHPSLLFNIYSPLKSLLFTSFHFFSSLRTHLDPVLGCEMNEINDKVLLKKLCQKYLALLAGLPRIACRFVDRYRADYPQWLGGSTHSSTLISNIFLWK